MCHQPSGFRTRVDGSIYQGYKVTPYYDSMICKLICHGRNRKEAIQRMNRSLEEFVIEGSEFDAVAEGWNDKVAQYYNV